MSRLVVDASVAVKWYLDEPHAGAARRLLDGPFRLIVPGFFFAEVGNVLWKRWRRGELTPADVAAALDALELVPFEVRPTRVLLPRAVEIAMAAAHGRSVYDSLYLALAAERDARMITADRKFCDAVRRGPLAPRIRLGGGRALRRSAAPHAEPPAIGPFALCQISGDWLREE